MGAPVIQSNGRYGAGFGRIQQAASGQHEMPLKKKPVMP